MQSSPASALSADSGQIGAQTDLLLSAVNSKDSIESIKGRIIATNKLLKFLESAEKDKEAISSKLKKQIDELRNENELTKQRLKAAEEKNKLVLPTMVMPSSRNNEDSLKRRISELERELKTINRAKMKSDERLTSREMYIKQLEAQTENLSHKVKSLENDSKKRELAPSQPKEFEAKAKLASLEKELEELKTANETLEDEKMESSINYDMLNTAHTELQGELKQLRKKKDSLDLELQKNYTRIETLKKDLKDAKAQSGDCQELIQLRAKLEQLQHKKRSEHAEHSTMAISNPAGHDHATILSELRRYIAENEMLKKEKRVLQDRYTEQLVINADMESCQRTASLARILPEYAPARAADHRDGMQGDSRNRALNYRPESPGFCSPLTSPVMQPVTPDDTSSYNGRQGSHQASTQPRQAWSTDTDKITNTQHVSSSTSRQPVLTVVDSNKALLRKTDLVPPEPTITGNTSPAPRPKSRPSKLEKFAKARLPSSLISPSRKRPTEQSSLEPSKKPRKALIRPIDTLPKLPSVINHVELIKDRIDGFSKQDPIHSVALLQDMEIFTTSKIDVLLGSLEAFYHAIKSHSKPSAKLEMGAAQTHHYGLSSSVVLDCPANMDVKEKNIAWMLWSLSCMYPTGKPYHKFASWAFRKSLEHVREGKMQIACRYARLLSVLCKNAKEKQRLQTFCYDVVRWAKRDCNYLVILVNVAWVWSDVLLITEDARSNAVGSSMAIKTIERATTTLFKRADTKEVSKTLYMSMRALCGWSEFATAPSLEQHIEELTTVLISPQFKGLYSANQDAFDDLRFNLVKSFELAFWRLDNWKFTYDNFILTKLWPMMEDYIMADVSLELMGLLGRCGMTHSDTAKDLPGVKVLRDRLVQTLLLGNDCPDDEFPLQITAAKSVVLLTNGQSSRLLPVLKWFDDLKPTFRQRLPTNILSSLTDVRKTSTEVTL